MDDDLDAGLFGISLSDSEDAGAEPSEQSKIETQQNGGRTGQSEAAFQDVKSSYHVKIENGEVNIARQVVQMPQTDSVIDLEECQPPELPGNDQT